MQLLHPLVERILEKRPVADRETFLHPSYTDRHDPFLMKDMDKAVERILRAIEAKETIAVWHDYDCDGIPAGALLHDFFESIQCPIRAHVPERSDGYGLNIPGIEKLQSEGVTLIITVDCGITDVEEVARAQNLGVDVIITDHHLPQKKIPDAIAVVNAHQSDDQYPFKELCGTGVAFKLAEAILKRGEFSIKEGWEKWLLDLVALATVADMVPLIGENRALVHYGLKVMRMGKRPGLKALFELEKIPWQKATEDDIAFSIAPKVNAASRMASPKLAFELLTTKSFSRAQEIAKELGKLNKARKVEGMRVAKEVKHRLEMLPRIGEIIVLGNSTWRPSLLGIAATSVVDSYGKTVCLWGKDGGLIKGSCRSNGAVNIVDLMVQAKGAFQDFGGHEFSGGFSLTDEQVLHLEEELEKALAALPPAPEKMKESETYDGYLTIAEANEVAYVALRDLAPFGEGNPKPVFRITNARVDKFFRFGAGDEHARLVLSDDDGRTLDAISFFISRQPYRDTLELLSAGDRIQVDGSIEQSFFRGSRELRFRVEQMTFANTAAV